MSYSLRALVNLVWLIRGLDKIFKPFLPNVQFWCDYPFLDAAAYTAAVREYMFSKSIPSNELKEHLKVVRFLVDAMESMEREKNGSKVQCLYRCLAHSMDEEVYWFNPTETKEGLSYYFYRKVKQTEWEYSTTTVSPLYAIDYLGVGDVKCRYYCFSGEELFDKVCIILEEMKFLLGDTTDDTQPIPIPDCILKKLAETKCKNGKPFIEKVNDKTWKWLQNKQLARELLTHDKIKGNMIDAEIKRRTPNTFIYYRDGKPLSLSKNKPEVDKRDHNRLMYILATI